MKKTIKQHTKRTLVFGIGINDADYKVNPTVNGKQKICPYYRKWMSMLVRCYSDNYQAKQPTYIRCMVSEEWHSFMAFRSWMVEQDWQNKQLDKDILLLDNKIYSAENCIFVTRAINQLFTGRKSTRGKYPQGVSYSKQNQKYQAQITINGKLKHIDHYKTVEQAEQAYLKEKAEYVKQHMEYNKHDTRLVAGLKKHLKLIEEKITK